MTMSKREPHWIVNVLGTVPRSNTWVWPDPDKGSPAYEISIVRSDYTHGRQSFGWSGQCKFILFSNNDEPRPPRWLWLGMIALATRAAHEMNARPIFDMTVKPI